MSKKFYLLATLLLIGALLVACTPTATEEPTAAPETQAPETEVPDVDVTEEPEPVGRLGGWLDQIVYSLVSAESAITQLQAGAIDVYGTGLASSDFPAIEAAGMKYSTEIGGTYYELTYNPYCDPEGLPVFSESTGGLNPFCSQKVREAMNWLVDRDFLNQEIYAGGGLPKFFSIITNSPDYADFASTVRALEAKYAYNPDLANEVISAEMTAMGAEMGEDGLWKFGGETVTIIMLIRTDHDGTRRPVGDYVAGQLESIGFAVDRQYKTSSEASPIWVLGNVGDGLFHIYTGAWGATVIDRDQGDNFQFFSTAQSAYGFSTLWQNYACGTDFEEVSDDLAYNRFTSLDERETAFRDALTKDSECGLRTWLIDGGNFAPYNQNVDVTWDIAAGIGNSQIYPYTMRFVGEEGGLMKFGQPDMFVDPWNPIAGSNWSYDGSVQRATQGGGVMFDPYTGLVWPLRIERAELTVQEGLPVGVTHDWITLAFEPEIAVPDDAFVDWDAASQTFITAADAGGGMTAQYKSVVYYPADLFDTITWHDGSPFSVADMIMLMIMTFDPGKEGSAIYDEAQASSVESFLSVFKGFRITSMDPLTIEYYQDGFQLDAEINVTTLWPVYNYGEAGWHQIAIGNLADAAGELAYSADKADANEIEWMSFIGGPSLDILASYLDQAASESYIPYEATLGQYITPEEAAARYANLQAWYAEHGHFWSGTGPYYLDRALLTEDIAVLNHFDGYPDPANRWSQFTAPKFAEVEIDGPGVARIGEEAVYDVFVTFQGDNYPTSEIDRVIYLLYDATGALVSNGEAVAVEDGLYQVILSADVMAGLTQGAYKLEVAAIPLVVAVPTFESIEFIVTP